MTATPLQIRISVDRLEPICGYATLDLRDPDVPRKPLFFDGWLGCLRVLTELLKEPGEADVIHKEDQ